MNSTTLSQVDHHMALNIYHNQGLNQYYLFVYRVAFFEHKLPGPRYDRSGSCI